MKMMIVTGGTGGHIYPALALAQGAKQRYGKQVEIVFVGNDDRMEAKLIPEKGYPFYALHTSGFVGNTIDKAKAVALLLRAYQKAKKYIRSFHPDIVIGFGGYVSAPVILAAHHLGIPTMIHEQNSIIGKANQLVMKKVDAIVCCYEKCLSQFDENKTRLLGNPRATFAAQTSFDEAYFRSLGLDPQQKTVLIVMGSLGSSSINELMKDALGKIKEDCQFLYVCGQNNSMDPNVFKEYPSIHVVDYVDQLAILSHVDLIVCRAGATTLAEITALGVPAILVPSPYVAHNHQFYNASVLVENEAAVMIEEKDLCAKTLHDAISSILHDPIRMEHMKMCSRRLGKPKACQDILDWCEQLEGGMNK